MVIQKKSLMLMSLLGLITNPYSFRNFGTILFIIILFSGVQLFALGVIGEYVLRVFFQSKNRPLFIVKETIVDKEFSE